MPKQLELFISTDNGYIYYTEQKIYRMRSDYLNATGHYGSDKEVITWYEQQG